MQKVNQDTIEFNSASVKNLSGEKTVTARNLNQNPIHFNLSVKINFLANFHHQQMQKKKIYFKFQLFR